MLGDKATGLNEDLAFGRFDHDDAESAVGSGRSRLSGFEVFTGGDDDPGVGQGFSIGRGGLALHDEAWFQSELGLAGEQSAGGYQAMVRRFVFAEVDFGGQEFRVRELEGKRSEVFWDQRAAPMAGLVCDDQIVFEGNHLAHDIPGDAVDRDVDTGDRLAGQIAHAAADRGGRGHLDDPVRGRFALGPLHARAGMAGFEDAQCCRGGIAAAEVDDTPPLGIRPQQAWWQGAQFAGAIRDQYLAVGQGLACLGVLRGYLELQAILSAGSRAQLLHQGEGIGVLFPEERGFVVIAGIADIEDPIVNMAAEQGDHGAELFHLDLFPLAHGEFGSLIAPAAGFSLAELIDVGTMHLRLAITPRLRRATPGFGR